MIKIYSLNTMKSIYSVVSLIPLRSGDAWVWTAGIKYSLGIILGTLILLKGALNTKRFRKGYWEPQKSSSTLHSVFLFELDVPMFLHVYSFGNLKCDLNESLTVLEKKLDEVKLQCKRKLRVTGKSPLKDILREALFREIIY